MKKNLVVLSLVVVFTLTASFVFAGSEIAMHVKVPFDFYAGGQQFSAGEYIFEMSSGLLPTAASVKILSSDGKPICILNTQAGTDENQLTNLLRFNQYGDKQFLSSVSIQGFKAGIQMLNLEKELKAQMEKEQKTVVIAQK
jgi:hypothetical protein